jgi:uncharacterized protein Smg (DUF494 family)
MLSRLMDLVVLVAEIAQDNDRYYKDLDQELLTRGYNQDEIDRAVVWYTTRGEVPEGEEIIQHGKSSFRVLSQWERMSLSSECYGYLLRLLHLGIVDGDHFEKIIARSIPVGPEKVQLNDVKEIACSVLFNRDTGELEDELVDFLDDGITAT